MFADLEVEETNRAKALIEDFMIAANGVTARYLEARGYPSLRRILRSPARWERIVELAAALGESLPPEPAAAALEAFLAKRRRADPLRFPDETLLGQSKKIAEVVRALVISDVTDSRWRQESGGMTTAKAKRLNELEHEDGQLQKIVADLTLDMLILHEAAKRNF